MTGCYRGDSSAVRTVSLNLPIREGQTKATPSVGNAEVQEALKLIDNVLVSNGLTPVPNLQTPSPDGTILHYLGPPTKGCSVSLKDDKLIVVFLEFKQRHSSESVKKICNLLEEKLKDHYGNERVTVGR